MTSLALDAYHTTILGLGLAGALFLVQLLVVDVAGIRARHEPGTPIEPDHGDFHFRANRALANKNESVAAFLLLTIFCLLVGADPAWTNGLTMTWVVGRAGHMACYYAGWGIARSTFFGLALIALLGLGINGAIAIA